jgi:hypothetical protein
MNNKEEKISREIAVEEVLNFINYYSKKPIQIDEVKDKHETIVDAVVSGHLIFEDNKPFYTLVHPIKNSNGDVTKDKVEFKTRIRPNTKADLAKGIDLQKDVANYSLRIIAHIIGTTTKELDLFEPIDYDVISEVSTLFMNGGR